MQERWEKLMTEFKKIFDFQANTPSGGNGYFELTRPERREQSLPTTFQEEIYEAMVQFVPANRAVNPVNPDPNQYVDSTADAEAEQSIRRQTAPRPAASDLGDDTHRCRFDGYEESLSQEMHEDSYVPSETPTEAPTPHASEEIGGEQYTPTQPIGEDPYTPTQPIGGDGYTPTQPIGRDRYTATQPVNSSTPNCRGGNSGVEDAGASTSRGWKRKQTSERTPDEMQRISSQFVGAIGEDREARQEEHTQLLEFYNSRHNETLAANLEATRSSFLANMEATRSARETGVDVAKALTYMADALRHLAPESSRRSPDT